MSQSIRKRNYYEKIDIMADHKPAYLIGNFSVTDPALMAEYRQKAGPIRQRYGGEITTRVSDLTPVEGTAQSVLIVIRFPSMAQAEAFYYDPDYEPAKALRIRATEGGFLALVPETPPV